MLTHSNIWRAIDELARDRGYTVSGLAKRAGLNPTSFNKSKRISAEGKHRWPSTESIAKLLHVADASLSEFLAFMDHADSTNIYKNIPLIGFVQAGQRGFFDDAGYPVGGAWDEIPFPGFSDKSAYGLEISGDSMEPVYRDGDIVIVSPEASIRRGDRVVLKTREGEVMAKVLKRKTAHKVLLSSINPQYEDRELEMDDIEWIARIVWSSQ